MAGTSTSVETLAPVSLVAYRVPLDNATSARGADTVAVLTTLLVAGSMTLTELPLLLDTYTTDPSGETATASGKSPTGIEAVTVLEAVETTESVLEPLLVTYSVDPLGERVMPYGLVPTAIDPGVPAARPDVVLRGTTETVPDW
jgi:hypothetical protein